MSIEADRVRSVVRFLGLNKPYALSGSGSLLLRGFDLGREVRDVDLFVTTAEWFRYYRRGGCAMLTAAPADRAACCDPPVLRRAVQGLPVEMYFAYRPVGMAAIDMPTWLLNAEDVDGVSCVPLQMLLDWKSKSGRAKDVQDVKRVKEQMSDAL